MTSFKEKSDEELQEALETYKRRLMEPVTDLDDDVRAAVLADIPLHVFERIWYKALRLCIKDVEAEQDRRRAQNDVTL